MWWRLLNGRKNTSPTSTVANSAPIPLSLTNLWILFALVCVDAFADAMASRSRALANLGHEVSDQTVGNVLRRHGIPPAPERKRRTTRAEFIRIHLALLAGTDVSAAEVLMRGLVTCYVLFLIYLGSSRIDISRSANCPNRPCKLRVTRNVRIRGRGTRQRCCALQDRDTIYFTSFQATRARPVRSVSVGAGRVDGSPRERVFV